MPSRTSCMGDDGFTASFLHSEPLASFLLSDAQRGHMSSGGKAQALKMTARTQQGSPRCLLWLLARGTAGYSLSHHNLHTGSML